MFLKYLVLIACIQLIMLNGDEIGSDYHDPQ